MRREKKKRRSEAREIQKSMEMKEKHEFEKDEEGGMERSGIRRCFSLGLFPSGSFISPFPFLPSLLLPPSIH